MSLVSFGFSQLFADPDQCFFVLRFNQSFPVASPENTSPVRFGEGGLPTTSPYADFDRTLSHCAITSWLSGCAVRRICKAFALLIFFSCRAMASFC